MLNDEVDLVIDYCSLFHLTLVREFVEGSRGGSAGDDCFERGVL